MHDRVRIKICGITNLKDAMAAAELGVDALGFVRAPSPRQIPVDLMRAISRRLPASVVKVGVFVDAHLDDILKEADQGELDVVQLHGQESPEIAQACVSRGLRVIKAFRVRGTDILRDIQRYVDCQVTAFLLDAYVPGRAGGTGQVFDWQIARHVARRYRTILAGGLHPGNVQAALSAAAPWGVDVSSGVESRPGYKCSDLMARFVRQIRAQTKERSVNNA